MGKRRKARVYALQMLFQHDITGERLESVLKGFWEGRRPSEEIKAFTGAIVYGVVEEKTGLDGVISRYSKRWKLERIALVDRNILRIAIYEYVKLGTPKGVAINEAIEISRYYSTRKSPEFINGLLDKAMSKLIPKESIEEACEADSASS